MHIIRIARRAKSFGTIRARDAEPVPEPEPEPEPELELEPEPEPSEHFCSEPEPEPSKKASALAPKEMKNYKKENEKRET